MLTRTVLGSSLLVVVAVACGGKTAGETVRPKDPTYASATGDNTAATCTSVGEEGKPLVVDWKPEERTDLQAALKGGVAIVHYDCQGIKLLPDCQLDGNYGYVGTTTQEQVISLNNADEVKANLPLNGPKLSANLQRNASLDIGLLLIGKMTTSALKVSKTQLTGRCDGATHFVRDATIGGFAMNTGTVGKVGAAADIFGASASASSDSTKGMMNKSGDIAACRAASVDATTPPGQCGAPVRLRLLAITDGPPAESKAPPKAAGGKPGPKPAKHAAAGDSGDLDALLASLDCPAGMTYTAGKCTRTASAAHTCKPGDAADCTAQCNAGDTMSCARIGQMYFTGKGVANDKKQAATFSDKACKGGIAHACYVSGNSYVGMDPPQLSKEYEAFAAGCALGDPESCRQQAGCVEEGEGTTKDVAKAMGIYARACNAGSNSACSDIGQNYLSGIGVKKDENLGLWYIERACFGGRFDACTGGDSDAEMKRNSARHVKMADFACRSGYAGGCISASEAYSPGGYAPPAKDKAADYRAKACALNKNACKK